MARISDTQPRSSSDGLEEDYPNMLRQHQADLAARETRTGPAANEGFSAYKRPDNLPPGFKVYEDESGRSNIYMQGPDGKLHFTPDYARNHGMHIDWPGVALDLAGLAVGGWGGATAKTAGGVARGVLTGGIGAAREVRKVDRQKTKPPSR